MSFATPADRAFATILPADWVTGSIVILVAVYGVGLSLRFGRAR